MCFGGNNNSPDPAPAPEPQEPVSWADAHLAVTEQTNPDGSVSPTAEGLAIKERKTADQAKREKKSRDKYKSKGRRPDGSHYADYRDPASRNVKSSNRPKRTLEKTAREQYIDDLRANPDGW